MNTAEYYQKRGWEYCDEEDYDNAIADFTEAIRLNPSYADAYCGRGYAYEHCGDFAEAIADYTESIRLMPDITNAAAYLFRGDLYKEEIKDFDKAIADYETIFRMDPNNDLGHHKYAKSQIGDILLYNKKETAP